MLATRGDNRRILSNPVLQWCVAAAALIGPAGIVLISGHRHAPGDPLLSSHSGPLATEVPGLLVSDRVMDLGSVPHGAIAVAKFQLTLQRYSLPLGGKGNHGGTETRRRIPGEGTHSQ